MQLMRMVTGMRIMACRATILHRLVSHPDSLFFLVEFIVATQAQFTWFIDEEIFLIAGVGLVADDASADSDWAVHEFFVHVVVGVTGLAESFCGVFFEHEFVVGTMRVVASHAVAFHDGCMYDLIEFEGVAGFAELGGWFGECEDVIINGLIIVAIEAFQLRSRGVHDFVL